MATETQRSRTVLVAVVLRVGLVVGGLLVAIGLLLSLGEGDRVANAVRPFDILHTGVSADTLMALGMLVFGATPVAGVATLIVIWARERDYRFAALALLVMIILVLSALTGVG